MSSITVNTVVESLPLPANAAQETGNLATIAAAVQAATPAGTNIIGHVIVDSAGAVTITSLPSIPAGTNVIGHVIVDSLSGSVAITAASLPLPANAAQETGGNLAALSALITGGKLSVTDAAIEALISSGKLLVSDAALEACISASKLAVSWTDPAEGTLGSTTPTTALTMGANDPTGKLRVPYCDADGHLAAIGGWRIPIIVQKANAVTGSSGTSLTCAFGSNVTRGNTLVICCGVGATAAAPTATDTLLNEYVTALYYSGTPTMAVIFARVNASGANTVTLAWAGSAGAAVEIYEVAGIGGVDVAGLTLNSTTNAPSLVMYNLRPNSLGFFVVGAGAGTISNNNPASPSNLAFDSGNLTPTGTGTLTNFGCFSTLLGPQQTTQACKCTLSGSVAQSSITVSFRPEAVDIQGTVSLMGRSGTGTELPLLTDTVGNLCVAKSSAGADGVSNSAGGGFASSGAAAVVPLQVQHYLYNGSTWDRQRANFDTTTGDSGVKNASGTGATQTNYNARVAFITALAGAVVGSGILTFQFQWSIDGGTTWLSAGSASGNITASGQTACFVVGAGIAASPTTGATQTVAVQMPLPRTWRIAWTLVSGTSMVITGVYVNYQN